MECIRRNPSDPTLDPTLQSWVESANEVGGNFPIQNLPWGVFVSSEGEDRIGVAIGDMILDVKHAIDSLALQGLPPETACGLCASTLNAFMGQGHDRGMLLGVPFHPSWPRVRIRIHTCWFLGHPSPCDFRHISVITPTSTPLVIMPRMSGGCSGPMPSHCCPTI